MYKRNAAKILSLKTLYINKHIYKLKVKCFNPALRLYLTVSCHLNETQDVKDNQEYTERPF